MTFDRFDGMPSKHRPLNGHHGSLGRQSSGLRRPTTKEIVVFWSLNALVMPIVALVYVVVVAEGLRVQMGIFAMRLYKLPVPGAGLLRQYDGFDRLDLAIPMSLMLFAAVSYLWLRFWKESAGSGSLASKRQTLPFFFWMQVAIAAIIVSIDAGIFYMGLAAKAASGWSDTPAFVPVAATVLYAAGLAMLGAWHADFHAKRTTEEN